MEHCCSKLRDWSLITGTGGATKLENRGSETFCTPPPQDGLKLFMPPFQRVETFRAPPTIWLKLQATS